MPLFLTELEDEFALSNLGFLPRLASMVTSAERKVVVDNIVVVWKNAKIHQVSCKMTNVLLSRVIQQHRQCPGQCSL